MSRRLFGIVIIITMNLSACGNSLEVLPLGKSLGKVNHTVQKHPNHDGVYLVHYRHHKLIDEYGPGVENVRNAIRNDPKKWRQLWDEAAAEAVTRYMLETGLVPAECSNGIVIVSSGSDEAGGGTSAFRCKKK